MFIVSPHVDARKAFEAWKLEGEQSKPISSGLLRFLKDYKARDIIKRKDDQYRRAQKKLNGRRTEDKNRG